jgi:hypothetical protein
MPLGSTEPLTEMNTKNLPVGKGRPARKVHHLTAIYEQSVQKIWGALTSYNPMGFHGLLQG